MEARWPSLGFLWSMLTMGSGTAFVSLALLAFYFIKRIYVQTIVPLIFVFYFFIPYIEFTPLQRAYDAVNAAMTLETDEIIEKDASAAVRITPMINTLTNLDLLDFETWFGHGIDYGLSVRNVAQRMNHRMMGSISEYGLMSFIVMQILIFTCVIKRFFSVETLFWLFLFGMSFSNISYTWGAMMIFTTVRYFQIQDEKGFLEFDDEDDFEEENEEENEKQNEEEYD